MPASVPSPLSSTLPIQLLSPPLLPGSLPASLTAEQACFYKAAVKRRESWYGRSWSLFRRSKILHGSVYSALWLGGLRCQCRRQTNGPLTARCPCVMVLGKKKKFCRPLQCVGPPGKCPVCPITSPALVTFDFQYMFDFFKVPTWGWVNVDRNVFLGEIPLRYKGKGEKNTQIDI